MKLYEITFSPTGGTKKAADMLVKAFPEACEKIDLLNYKTDYSGYQFEKDDICIVAVPSYGGRVPGTAVERLSKFQGNGAVCILLAVYGNREFEDTLIELKNTMKAAGFLPVAAVAAIAEHSIMRQFGSGRPDEQDKKELEEFGVRIRKALQSEGALAEVVVPGNETYKDFHVFPMNPSVSGECSRCGLCVRECPVEAIDCDTVETIGEKCISCMRCIAVCPEGARALSREILAGLVLKLEKACSGYKANQLFLE